MYVINNSFIILYKSVTFLKLSWYLCLLHVNVNNQLFTK